MANKKTAPVKQVEEEIKEVKGSVIPELLNIRKEPNITSEIVALVSRDHELLITNLKKNNGFYAVNVEGVDGFAMAEFVKVL